MEKVSDNPLVMIWHRTWIVKISDVGEEFANWIAGQTLPLVTESDTPTDFAYYSDYSRFVNKQLVID